MRIVVTGGAGFIGANLCRALLGAGHDVVVLDDLSTGNAANLDGLPVRFVEGSVLSEAALDDACTGADAVVHLAALGSVPRSVAAPMPTLAANATGTAMVMEAARRHGGLHVLLSSSSSVYGANPTLPKHEGMQPQPMSPYAASKLAAESYALSWAHAYRLPVLVFRFFNVFGPLQPADHIYAAVIPRFLAAAIDGQPVTIYGDGLQSRDFTYVGTVTDVLTDAVQRRVTSDGPVNLAFGGRVTLLDIADRVEKLVGAPLQRRHEPERVGDVRHSQAAHHRLTTLFPATKPIDLDEGLAATLAWMRSVRTGPADQR